VSGVRCQKPEVGGQVSEVRSQASVIKQRRVSLNYRLCVCAVQRFNAFNRFNLLTVLTCFVTD